jgi:hypothetical protein
MAAAFITRVCLTMWLSWVCGLAGLRVATIEQGRTERPAVASAKGYAVKEIRGGVYWVTDGLYNTMFVVSSSGVIAVDPLPNLGPKYLRAIAEVTDKPVTHVIYSHEHTDHIGAANQFPRNAVYIAQQQTAALLSTRHDPRRPVPTVTFDTTYTLSTGGQTLVLDYKGRHIFEGQLLGDARKPRGAVSAVGLTSNHRRYSRYPCSYPCWNAAR